MPVPEIRIIGITGIPEVHEGDNVGRFLVEASQRQGTPMRDRDVVAVTQKSSPNRKGGW